MRFAFAGTALASLLAMVACGDSDGPEDGGAAGSPGAAGFYGAAGAAGAHQAGAGGEAGTPPTPGAGAAGAAGSPATAGGPGEMGGAAGAANGTGGTTIPDDVPNYEAWASSAHADATAEAFRHWDTEGGVPTSCAKCHSGAGFEDYIGADGSAPDKVDAAAPIDRTVDCQACHNEAANELSAVTFPSGVVISGLGGEARCMTCHQGRESTVSVDARIDAADLDTDDTVSDPDGASPLGFANIHYYAAAATLYAGEVMGGYQYDGQVYDHRFRHAPGYETCIDCHDSHSLEVRVEECADCHDGVSAVEDLRDVRMIASLNQDYDGDGDTTEGIYYELEGLRLKLFEAIQAYGAEQGAPICYDSHNHPYFFGDTDEDGTCAAEEAVRGNAYASWTARLLRAAYNFQTATKDRGAFAHNAKYIFQILFDSITDLNAVLDGSVDMSAAVRNDTGHFNGSGEAARHWDADAAVSASCSKCHAGSEGLDFYLTYGVGKTVEEQDNGLDCATCHVSFGDEFAVRQVDSVTFPSGAVISDMGDNGLCTTCHSGRASGDDVKAAFANGGSPTRFINVHYNPGGAMLLGTLSGVGYEFDGMSYSGVLDHAGGTACAACHAPTATNHSFKPEDTFENATCGGCHGNFDSFEAIRPADVPDVDGDGSTDETMAAELEGLAEALLGTMFGVSWTTGTPLCYGDQYPYFLVQSEGGFGGECDEAALEAGTAFTDWTEPLLAAAFNYQLVKKDHGAWAHNFDYAAQLLIDSMAGLEADVSGFTRPEIE